MEFCLYAPHTSTWGHKVEFTGHSVDSVVSHRNAHAENELSGPRIVDSGVWELQRNETHTGGHARGHRNHGFRLKFLVIVYYYQKQKKARIRAKTNKCCCLCLTFHLTFILFNWLPSWRHERIPLTVSLVHTGINLMFCSSTIGR
jgi:hypothetical protein